MISASALRPKLLPRAKLFFPKLSHVLSNLAAPNAASRVDILGHVAADDERGGAFLLRDNNSHGIGLFGDAERGAVARAPGFAQVRIGAERQETTHGGDPPFLDHERAVMDRRMRQKDALDQLAAYPSIEPRADFHVFVKTDFAFEHDQRADMSIRKRHGRLRDFVDDIFACGARRVRGSGEQRRATDLFRATDRFER